MINLLAQIRKTENGASTILLPVIRHAETGRARNTLPAAFRCRREREEQMQIRWQLMKWLVGGTALVGPGECRIEPNSKETGMSQQSDWRFCQKCLPK
jgi:hypothetical protein